MRLENFYFYCSNNFLLLHLNSDGIEDDNIQSLGHGLCLVKHRKLFTLCKIQSQRWNSAWGAKYPIMMAIPEDNNNTTITIPLLSDVTTPSDVLT